MLAFLTTLVTTYGYSLIFGLILLESAGMPLPGETMLIIGGAFAAGGHLSIIGVIFSAALGAILGDMTGYWLGRRGSTANLARLFGKRYDDYLPRGRIFFDRYGSGAVFLARFVPFVRVVSALLAGMTGMRFRLFSVYNIAGGITWATLMGSLGFIFGNNLPLLDQLLKRLGIGLVISILFITSTIWVGRRLTEKETTVRRIQENARQRLGLVQVQQFLIHRFRFPNSHVAAILAGFGMAVLAGWLFGALAEDVLAKDALTLYDAGIGRWFLAHATEDSNDFFFAVTQLGSTWMISAGSLLLLGWLAWRKRYASLVALIASVGGGVLLNLLLKNIFLRPRPDFANAYYHEIGYSFPSGHAMMAVLFYGMAAYLLATLNLSFKWKVWLGTSAFSLAMLIGLSRLALGVHYLTDVLGGWAAGLTWLLACVILYELIAAKPGANATRPG